MSDSSHEWMLTAVCDLALLKFSLFIQFHCTYKRKNTTCSSMVDLIFELFVAFLDARYCSFLDCRIDKTREWII